MVGLSERQREQLSELMRERLKPPLKRSTFDQQVLLVQLADLPEEFLKPIFDDSQWTLFSHRLASARGMKSLLIGRGIMPEPDKAANIKPDPKGIRSH
jgi:hypothetical protein